MNDLIPDRFARRVLTHALAATAVEGYPLILAIQGPSGDGKSYQLAKCLKAAEFYPLTLSGAALSGSHEGDSSKALHSLYERAQAIHAANDEWPAIVLEDFDLSPAGVKENTKYTVNSQLLTGLLMNLSERITSANIGTNKRFPIFLTGNDFTVLHKPLMRPGRMDIFTWIPSADEQALMILSALHLHTPNINRETAAKLQAEFPDLPIAAFAAAVNDCIAEQIYMRVTASGSLKFSNLQRSSIARDISIPLSNIRKALLRRRQQEFMPGRFIGDTE
ncbi:AAA family ATPase [Nonomuraea wenchangensis]|uniref:AAA family ATPase n=1 Tax=Nonomuraea wenchangensis TaxID=568860 RepID=UPI0034167446